MESNLSDLNINAHVFVPNVNAVEFVPSFGKPKEEPQKVEGITFFYI